MTQPPNKIDQLLKTAHLQYKQGNVTEARRIAKQIIELEPAVEDAWLILASASNLKQAIIFLQHATKQLPDSDRIQNMLSRAIKQEQARKTASKLTQQKIPIKKTENISREKSLWASQQDNTKTNLKTKNTSPSRIVFWLVLLAVLIGSFLVFFNRDRITTFAMSQKTSNEIERPAEAFLKPTRTPTNTHTPTPTPTNTPTLTPTPTNTPTLTFTPTLTSTNTPEPTNTLPVPTQVNVTANERWIDIDLSNQMFYAYEGDTIINSFLISSGMANTPTVIGQFAVYVKYEYADMSGPGYNIPAVPYTMYFYKDYGIHAATWHNNFGTPMSHGCINMRLDDAEWVFNWSSVGTTVNIHY